MRGIYYLFSHDKNLLKIKLEKAEAELIRLEVVSYMYKIAKRATEIDASLALSGTSTSFSDTIIAATALHYRLTLVTRNIEHFFRIPEPPTETHQPSVRLLATTLQHQKHSQETSIGLHYSAIFLSCLLYISTISSTAVASSAALSSL